MDYFKAGCGGACLYASTEEAEAGGSVWSTQGVSGRPAQWNTLEKKNEKENRVKKKGGKRKKCCYFKCSVQATHTFSPSI